MTKTTNSLRELIGLPVPLLQAPMAGVATPALAAAVERAGALGGLGCAGADPDMIGAAVGAARALGATRLNLNVFVHAEPEPDAARDAIAAAALAGAARRLDVDLCSPPTSFPTLDRDQVAGLVAARPAVVTCHFGPPPRFALDALHEAGVVVGGTATDPAEAVMLVEAGCDFVIAQGAEAGGHRGTFDPDSADPMIGTLALVPQVVDAVSVPVVAAGGIADHRGVAAGFALGASAVQVGTAFVASFESGATPEHMAELGGRSSRDTVVTRNFSGRSARAFANILTEAELPTAAFPRQFALTAPLRDARQSGVSAAAHWAGQAFGFSRREPAGDVVRRLMSAPRAVIA